MRRVLLAALVVTAAAALSAGALLAPGLTPSAAAGVVSGACSSAKGVTVVVNYGKYGGTTVRCFAGATSGTNGVEALQGAGFTPSPTNGYGLAFICRINNVPPPSDETCMRTPPATAYWSYWYAANGGSWTYSSKGATNRNVILGGFEGWSFHSGSGANTAPTSGSPTRPETPTITLGPAASATRKPTKSAGSTTTTAKPTASTANPSKTATGTPTGTTSTSPTPTGSTSPGGPSDSAGGALPGDRPSSGQSPWPFVGSAGGIALVLGGSALVVRRRRGGGG